MSGKKIIISVTAIILVIAIFIISEMMSDAKPPEHRTRLFPEIEERHVTALVISDRNSGIRLGKHDGQWMVSTAGSDDLTPADSASAQIAVEKIVTMSKSELISENPANQAAFETDSANGTTVAIHTTGKSEPAVLYIGKSGPEWNSNYVRREGTDAVYLLRGGIKYALFTDFERWKKPVPPPETEPDTTADANAAPAVELLGDNVLIGQPE